MGVREGSGLRSGPGGVAALMLLAAVATAGDARSEFLKTQWVVVPALADVDARVMEAVRARWGDDPAIADRGEPFQSGDVITGERPTRRFALAGHSEDRWFFAYEQGGFARQVVLFTLEREGEAARITMEAWGSARGHRDESNGWGLSLDELRDAVKKGDMKVTPPRGR